MSSNIPLLSNVQVAAPCSAAWNHMEPVDGDRVHFCAGCKKNVYNLSAMTQNQAEGLLRKHEGHLCVRYYKRTDGTILTQNCPVGQAALRMKMIARSKHAAVAAAALASIAALGTARFCTQSQPVMGAPAILEGVQPSATAPEAQQPITGALRIAPRPNQILFLGEMSYKPEPEHVETIGKARIGQELRRNRDLLKQRRDLK